MFSTLSLASILATQDRPVQGLFGLSPSFHWSRNFSDTTTLVVNRPETALATVMTGGTINRNGDPQSYPIGLSLIINGTSHPFWITTPEGGSANIELKNGTYMVDFFSLPTNWTVTLHGYYTQRTASTTSHRDPWLTTDRLWQHFSPRDGETFTVTDSKTVMTYIGDATLQRQSGANFISVYNIDASAQFYPDPGVVLVPGVYRLKPLPSMSLILLQRGPMLLVGGYKAP